MHKRSLNELVSLCFNQCNASSNFGSSKHSNFQKKQTQETFEQDRQHHVAFLSGRFFPGLPLLWFWVHFLIVLHSLLQRLCHHSHDFSCLHSPLLSRHEGRILLRWNSEKAAILGVRDSMEKVVQAVQSEIKERQEACLVVIFFVT